MQLARSQSEPTFYEQLIGLPANLTGEIFDGELFTQPRPSGCHAIAGSALGMRLGNPYRFGEGGPGGWWILDEPEIHFVLDTVVVVPDLGGWRQERMPTVPEDHRFEIVPDWVCEILSPSTVQKDRARKLPLYARCGVGHCWLVDPVVRTLEAFSLTADGHWLLIATLQDDEPVSVPPFDAISFLLSDLWT